MPGALLALAALLAAPTVPQPGAAACCTAGDPTEGDAPDRAVAVGDARDDTLSTGDEAEEEPELTLGGALRFNLVHRDWIRGGPDDRVASFDFDTFRLNADGTFAGLVFSAEYRFYAGYHMIHHGWVGYAPTEALTVLAGVNKVPFGALPYASHNWFFQLPYYVGLEDDYDAGLKAAWETDRWSVQAAFYPNDEGAYTGSSAASARYSYDVVPSTPDELGYAGLDAPRSSRERNQLNIRVARTWRPTPDGRVEVGASGQWGRLHDAETDRIGDHWAAGVHVDATHGRWNLIAEAIRYALDPADAPGRDGRFVVMGAYDAPYRVASRAALYLAGLAYTVPVDWGPVASIRVYDDYTHMAKDAAGYPDTRQNVLGAAVAAGPLLIYVDVASGRNHPWLGPRYGAALADGGDGGGGAWHTRLNVNLGYYF
jgi:hypothetical protein